MKQKQNCKQTNESVSEKALRKLFKSFSYHLFDPINCFSLGDKMRANQ